MDILQQSVMTYELLMTKNYIIYLENSKIIELDFKKYYFPHLIGLQYLTDRSIVQQSNTNNASKIYQNIKNGRITYNSISGSDFIKKIYDRILLFPHCELLMNCNTLNLIIDFDKSKVKSCKLNAEYIIYDHFLNGYIHLCLAYDKKKSIYYPETFIFEPSKYYISDQNLLECRIEAIEKRPDKTQLFEPSSI